MSTPRAIEFRDVCFSYVANEPVLEDLSFAVNEGEFVALTGQNGSGKSTIAKLIDGLLLPNSGTVTVFEMDTKDSANTFDIRRSCGIVFQNPDDQLVATLVHDEVAFGPANIGCAPDEIRERVDKALSAVGLSDAADADVNTLSGGQKQRVAIAGALAMRPRILILDEATSMLDLTAASEVLDVVRKLHADGMTIFLITHDEELARTAERIIQIGSPQAEMTIPNLHVSQTTTDRIAIQFEDVTFSYSEDASPVLKDFDLRILQGEFVIITGQNGCGKSTLLKLANGLLESASGKISIFESVVDSKESRNKARFEVGLAFQHPEQQLFESTVYDDIAFGPRNIGFSEEEVTARVRKAMSDVGLLFDEFYKRNPFTLSGGQQRKAAIAGVLAMQTPILALDEPCAGLDTPSKHELVSLLTRLNREGVTILMVTHDPHDAKLLGCRQVNL